jgi:hypothetical protein
LQRCDARLPLDLKEYDVYRTDVERYRHDQQDNDTRDRQILQRLDRNLPGAAGPQSK